MQRAPLTFGTQGVGLEEKAVIEWNQDLANMSQTLHNKHLDATSFVFSTYDVYTKALDDPKVFPQTAELKDATGFCGAYS